MDRYRRAPYLGVTVATHTLIVSNPPHSEVDLAQAAGFMGLSPAEVRMKANYPVPEIWLADTDPRKLEEAAAPLQRAGLNIVLVAGEELLNLPSPASVQSFTFTDSHLVATLDHAEVKFAYNAPVICVYCTPAGPVGGATGGGGSSLTGGLGQRSSSVFMTRDSLVGFGGLGARSSAAGMGEEAAVGESPFVDLYAAAKGAASSATVIQEVVDFSGLGEEALPSSAGNLAVFVAECEQRFNQVRIDRRLVNMQARQRPMVLRSASVEQERKGYSYATETLSQLLESISPELKDLTQFQLCSRLAYLTSSASSS